MVLCERNIDCLTCSNRGMCSNSYALLKYEQGREDIAKELLSICNGFPNGNDCVDCPFSLWRDNEWNGCAIVQLKEGNNE